MIVRTIATHKYTVWGNAQFVNVTAGGKQIGKLWVNYPSEIQIFFQHL
jgi:hypothetical protein